MTFEAISLSNSPRVTRPGFEKSSEKSRLNSLKAEVAKKEASLNEKQEKILALYTYHMKLIIEEKRAEDLLYCSEKLDDIADKQIDD